MKITKRNGRLAAIGLATAGVVAGGVLAVSGIASAATATPTPSTSATSSTTSQAQPGPGGATPVRSDEKAVDASQASTLKAAAEKAVPGGTVVRAETDAGDAKYEVHMTKADGSPVTVKFDANLNVTKVETGMGQGDPMNGGPQGGPQGAPQGSPQGPPSGSATPNAGGAAG